MFVGVSSQFRGMKRDVFSVQIQIELVLAVFDIVLGLACVCWVASDPSDLRDLLLCGFGLGLFLFLIFIFAEVQFQVF